VHFQRLEGDAQPRSRASQRGEGLFRIGVVCIPDDPHTLHAWNGLLEQLELLAAQLRKDHRQAGHVAARTCQAGDKPGARQVGTEGNDDGDALRGLAGDSRWRCAGGDEHIHRKLYELSHEVANQLHPVLAVPPLQL
jgi:hypothetical protein